MARILVVDDEIGIRELLYEILYDEGYTVELAENAAQAREARLKFNPDLVLLDIWMPDTDGVSLLKEWCAQGLLTMPVIMMSGHGTIDTATEAVRIGAMAFLEKPIALQKLLKTVKEGLSRGASFRANPTSMVAPVSPVVAVPSATATSMISDGVRAGMTTMASGVPVGVRSEDSATILAEKAIEDFVLPADQLVCASGSIDLNQDLREARDEFERIYFNYHLLRENYSMTRVSKSTGLERTNLYRKLRQLGIETKRDKNKE